MHRRGAVRSLVRVRVPVQQMPRLFAHHFTVAAVDAEEAAPELTYDEDRALSVTAEGHVFVERVSSSDTTTLTKVRMERPDETDEPSVLNTETRVRREREDRVGDLVGLDTLTEVRGEHNDPAEDYAVDAMLATESKATGERPDVDAAGAFELETKTAVPREPPDRTAEVLIEASTGRWFGRRARTSRTPSAAPRAPRSPLRTAAAWSSSSRSVRTTRRTGSSANWRSGARRSFASTPRTTRGKWASPGAPAARRCAFGTVSTR